MTLISQQPTGSEIIDAKALFIVSAKSYSWQTVLCLNVLMLKIISHRYSGALSINVKQNAGKFSLDTLRSTQPTH